MHCIFSNFKKLLKLFYKFKVRNKLKYLQFLQQLFLESYGK